MRITSESTTATPRPAMQGTTTTPRLVFTLAVLLGINTMNFFDRQILPAVQEKFRASWDLSDSKLGWLGTAFILLYAVVGLPLGRLADVGPRKWILAACVALWSLFTIASGMAWNFASLFAVRMGVGIGEAGCAPAANSLIGDLVPAEKRARAIGLFMVGLPMGLALSFLVSSTIAQHYSWQYAFYVAGVPGLMLAVAAIFLVDPQRGGADAHAHQAAGDSDMPFLSVAGRVLRLPTMWWIIASGALHNFNMYALGTFLASFLKRFHQLTVEQAGQISSLVYGFGALGIFGAGWVGDRAFRRGVSGRLHVAWIGLAASVPCLLLALAAPAKDIWQCATWLLPACLLLYAYYGTVYASIQDIIEPRFRGTAMAIYFCAMYLLGAVLGPWGTGALSDYCANRAAGPEVVASVVELRAKGLEKEATALMEPFKAVGLHDAMYVIPALDVALVVVLIAAALTVKRDYLRLRKRLEATGIQKV